MMDIALEFKQFFDGLPATKGHIVAKMNWSRAKAPQPSLDKSEIWIPGDELARKSRRALSIWKRRLTDKQRKQLEIALTR